jgi:DNA-binding NarL/FixJ family response regulator
MDDHAVRVALADDDVLLREGIASLLERHGFEVVGQAGDASGLLALVREHEPEVVIVDIRMPPAHETEGLDAARVIRQEFPTAGILVLSAHVEVDHAMELLATGDRIGYMLKSRVTNVSSSSTPSSGSRRPGHRSRPLQGWCGVPTQRPTEALTPRARGSSQ